MASNCKDLEGNVRALIELQRQDFPRKSSVRIAVSLPRIEPRTFRIRVWNVTAASARFVIRLLFMVLHVTFILPYNTKFKNSFVVL
jgi:hypothetical protein